MGAILIVVIAALRTGLRLRRTHIELQSHLSAELARLASRTAELEENLSALDARAEELPVRISELQRNLAALRVLTNVLGDSLRQVQKALSFTSLKSSLTDPLARALKDRVPESDLDRS
jgi:chromosome segregation ATPase